VRAWAVFRGDERDMRIALCGYEGEHDMPSSWECVRGRHRAATDRSGRTATNENRKRERIWFSPHCLKGKDDVTKLEQLKQQIEKLSPAAKLLMASQLVGKGDYDCVELGVTIAEAVTVEWRAAQLFAQQRTT
jgi:hypothetical protein